MKYGVIKNDYKNIKRCVSFKLIEEVVVYNKGVFLEEFTRFKGDESYVIYDDGKITLTHNEDDATVFTSNDKGQVAFLSIINKIKSGEPARKPQDAVQRIRDDSLLRADVEIVGKVFREE